jgi:anti-sigma regulatory factor (Ser/Thr protein kinase)
VPSADSQTIIVRLAGGYPHTQLDRLLGQLQPILRLREPCPFSLDMNGLVFMCPTAQAIVAGAFHRVIDGGLAGDGSTIVMPSSQMVAQYLKRMDFFDPLVGHLPEEFVRREPVGFRPLQHFQDSEACYRASRELKDALAEACDLEEEVAAAAIHVCLAELAENVLFHSGSDRGGFAAAQGWEKKAIVEVAIVDTGVGIRESLTKNANYADISTDVEAIEKALEPMVTATPDRNTGLGLSVTRFLLRRNGGQLMVRSGQGAVYAGFKEHGEECAVPFPGTIVTLTARTDAPLDIKAAYDDLLAAGYQPNDDA